MNEVSNSVFEEALANKDNKNIINIVCKYYKNFIPPDELKTCGLMALFYCLKNHNHKYEGRKFTSSLYQYTVWQCKKYLRKNRKYSKMSELSFTYDSADKQSTESGYVNDCLDILSYKHSKILRNYYMSNMTLDEIGKENNYTASAAYQNLKKAEDEFRRVYSVE